MNTGTKSPRTSGRPAPQVRPARPGSAPRQSAARQGTRVVTVRIPWAALAVDLALVVLFSVIGRMSHGRGLDFLGLLMTAAPFLSGTLAGWALLVWRGTPKAASVGGGILVWGFTVTTGMLLRSVTGLGVQVSFVVVASLFTGLFLLGWRILGDYLVRRSSR